MTARRFRSVFASIVVLSLLWVTPHSMLAAAGDLDLTFGTGGVVTTGNRASTPSSAAAGGPDYVVGMAIQGDSKIVMSGICNAGSPIAGFCLARYDSDGSLDASFGSGGLVLTTLTGPGPLGGALAIQGDGEIVVAGGCVRGGVYQFCIARYNMSGGLDTFTDTAIPDHDGFATAVAVQSNGAIIAAGACGLNFCLVRYSANGVFGSSMISSEVGPALASAVTVQTDGKIVVGGTCFSALSTSFCLARYTTGLSLDSSYGTGGVTRTALGPGALLNGVALQSDGKIVAVGGCCAVRYNTNGSVDTAFARSGVGWRGVAIQSDGKIVAAGPETFRLNRFNSDGSTDTSFGTGGTASTSFPGGGVADAVALQRDGKIVVAGGCATGFCLARFAGSLNYVGRVTSLGGQVAVVHPDGSRIDAVVGSRIAVGDIIETSVASGVRIVFDDNTSFALDGQTRVSIDEFVYDPQTGSGNSFFSLLQGAFVYISGLIGKNNLDGDHIKTAVGCCGIRGSEAIVRYDSGTGIAEYDLILGSVTFTPLLSSVTSTFDAPMTIRFDASGVLSADPLSQATYDLEKSAILSLSAVDTTPPTVSVPAAIMIAATGAAGAPVTYTVSASDPDDAASAPVCVPAWGSTFPIGVTTVTCSSTDTHGNTGTGSFSVTVRPVANADHYSDASGKTLSVIAPGPLGNDFVASPATFTPASVPGNGSLLAAGSGAFSYAPTKGFVGTDSFTYTASSAGLSSDPATVTLSVIAPGADCNLADYPLIKGTTTLTLKGATLGGCYLVGVNLANAVATNANLRGADLAGAALTGADLSQANLAGAILTNANLSGANLSGANLSGAKMTGATLTGVTWSQTTCPDGTLSNKNGGTCIGHL